MSGYAALRSIPAALCISGLLITGFAAPAAADGEFFQFDLAPDASDAVAAITRGNLNATLGYSTYESGSAANAALTYSLHLGNVATMKLGPSIGMSFGESGDEEMRVGGKLGLESYIPTDFGHLFLLGEYNTIDSNWFVTAQTGFRSGFGVELSAGGSDKYDTQSLALTQKLGGGPVSLRAGYKFVAEEMFLGLSVNTF